MSQCFYLLASLLGAAARLHGNQCRSEVGHKRKELLVGHLVYEEGPFMVRTECGNSRISPRQGRGKSFA